MTDKATASPHPAPRGAERLFEPVGLGPLELKNRIAMAPMTRRQSPEGRPSADVAEYYVRRARGGVGLIITEGIYLDHPSAEALENVPRVSRRDGLAAWRAIVEQVQAGGARIACQLWHMGPARRLGDGPDRLVPGFGPVDIQRDGANVVKGMTAADIGNVVDSYARAALAAKAAGFDAVEIHGAHGYLIDAFLWPEANSRTDGYGGSPGARARLGSEVVTAMRNAVGPEFPILFRFSQWKSTDYDARIAQSPSELHAILEPLAAAGVDAFHASTRRIAEPAFPGSPLSLAGWTRKLFGRPVIGVGSVGLNKAHESLPFRTSDSLETEVAKIDAALRLVEQGEVDVIAVGRALIADADWATKVREGRFDDIRPLRPSDLQRLH